MYSKTELIDIVSIKTLYIYDFWSQNDRIGSEVFRENTVYILYVEQQLFDAGKEALSLRQ